MFDQFFIRFEKLISFYKIKFMLRFYEMCIFAALTTYIIMIYITYSNELYNLYELCI